MEDSPFSIVIPLYNKKNHIRQTLDSVLLQTIKPARIIVVDDGSTDGGADLIAEIEHPALQLVRQPNGGVSRARNRGIQEAKSEWIMFLDADDYLHPKFLETLASLVRKNPAVNMVATQYKSVAYDQNLEMQPWSMDENPAQELIDDLPTRWLKGTCFFTSSVAVRREWLKSHAIWFPEGESYGEDLDLWFRLAEQTQIALSCSPLVARMWVPGGLSTAELTVDDPPFVRRMIDRAAGTAPGIELTAVQRISLARFLRHRWVSLARGAISSGNRRDAMALLGKSRPYGIDKRWLFTAIMLFVMPPRMVHYWQHWRKRRRMILG